MYLTDQQRSAVLENLHVVPCEIVKSVYGLGSNPFMQYEDLLQLGRLALCRAAATADPQRPFEPYARICVRNALFSYINQFKNRPACVRALSFDVELDSDGDFQTSLYEVTGDRKQLEPLAEIECMDLLVRLAEMYHGVTRNGIIVILLRYLGHTDYEIARAFQREQNNLRAWVARARQRIRKNPMVIDFFETHIEEKRDKAC